MTPTLGVGVALPEEEAADGEEAKVIIVPHLWGTQFSLPRSLSTRFLWV